MPLRVGVNGGVALVCGETGGSRPGIVADDVASAPPHMVVFYFVPTSNDIIVAAKRMVEQELRSIDGQ